MATGDANEVHEFISSPLSCGVDRHIVRIRSQCVHRIGNGRRHCVDAILDGLLFRPWSLAVGGHATNRGSLHGFPTKRGYANYLVALEAAKGVSLQLTQLGCRGESTATMISGGDLCYKAPDSQLADAVAFLRSHRNQTGLVTVELGYNNIGACIGATALAASCAHSRVSVVNQQLPQILSALRAAAGPNVTIVGLGHADPFLAWALNGPTGAAKASASLKTMQLLNSTLATVYSSFSIPMVDVATAFNMTQSTPTTLAGVGTVPLNVAQACQMTWMCRPHPLPANMHPNNSGYQAIAAAIAAVLPAPY